MELTYKYPLDITGGATTNLISNEVADVPKTGKIIVPSATPFFTESLTIMDVTSNSPLTPNVDYKVIHLVNDLVELTGKSVCLAIALMTNDRVTKLSLTYQTIGGEYSVNYDNIVAMVKSVTAEEKDDINFDNIYNMPSSFLPTRTLLNANDVVGQGQLVDALNSIADAIGKGKKDLPAGLEGRTALLETTMAIEQKKIKEIDDHSVRLMHAMYSHTGVIGAWDHKNYFEFYDKSNGKSWSNSFYIKEGTQFNIGGYYVKFNSRTKVTLPDAGSTPETAICFDDLFLLNTGEVRYYRSLKNYSSIPNELRDSIAKEHGYDKLDRNLFKQGDHYATILGRIPRLNQGAYHPLHNRLGTTSCWNNQASGIGTQWHETIDKPFLVNKAACFDFRDVAGREAGAPYRGGHLAGSGGRTSNAGRPDELAYDAIYAEQFIPLYLSAKNIEVSSSLANTAFNRLFIGDPLMGSEGSSFKMVGEKYEKVDQKDYRKCFISTNPDKVKVSEKAVEFKGASATRDYVELRRNKLYPVLKGTRVCVSFTIENFTSGVLYFSVKYGPKLYIVTSGQGDGTYIFETEITDTAHSFILDAGSDNTTVKVTELSVKVYTDTTESSVMGQYFTYVDIFSQPSAMPEDWVGTRVLKPKRYARGYKDSWLALPPNKETCLKIEFEKGTLSKLGNVNGNIYTVLNDGNRYYGTSTEIGVGKYHEDVLYLCNADGEAVDVVEINFTKHITIKQYVYTGEPWKARGVPGDWRSKSSNGVSLLPDNSKKALPLNRKCMDFYGLYWTNDHGRTWNSDNDRYRSTIVGPGNMLPAEAWGSEVCIMVMYKVKANPLHATRNAFIIDYGNMIEVNSHLTTHGNLLCNDLLDKSMTADNWPSNYSRPLDHVSVIEKETIRPSIMYRRYSPAHLPIKISTKAGDRFYKAFPYVTANDQLHIVYKEIVANASGHCDDGYFNLVDYKEIIKNKAGVDIEVGQKSAELPFYVKGPFE